MRAPGFVVLVVLALHVTSCGSSSSPSAPTVVTAVAPTVTAISITAGPSLVAPGGQLTMNWAGASGRGCSGGGDWIAIYRVGAPDITGATNGHSDLWYEHLCGAASGTFTLIAPTEPGQYEFRYMMGDTSVARSNPVTVSVSAPS